MNRTGVAVLLLSVYACCAGGEAERSGVGASTASPRPPQPTADVQEQLPVEIDALLPSCSIGITLHPRARGETDPGPGLRSVSLYVPNLRLEEPAGQWPDGTPVSASARVSEDEARRMLSALGRMGFFAAASRHHSERHSPSTTSPPAGSTAGLPDRVEAPNVSVSVVVNDDDWYHYRVGTWLWGPQAHANLRALHAAAQGPAADLIERLVSATGP